VAPQIWAHSARFFARSVEKRRENETRRRFFDRRLKQETSSIAHARRLTDLARSQTAFGLADDGTSLSSLYDGMISYAHCGARCLSIGAQGHPTISGLDRIMRHGVRCRARAHANRGEMIMPLTTSPSDAGITGWRHETTAARSARWFYVGLGVAVLGAIAAGFGPSFYARPATMPALAPRVVAHGILFSGWVVLFLVQAALVASGQTKLHRQLGVAAAGLAVIMVVTAPSMAVALARRGLPPGEPLGLLLVILTDLLLFGLFVGAGIYNRRRSETHKRFMVLAMVSLLPPGISRWPIAVKHPAPGIISVMLLFLAAAPVGDLLTRRRLNRVSLWGGVAVLVSLPLRFAVGQTAMSHTRASWLIR
jgi:hypothetical protein